MAALGLKETHVVEAPRDAWAVVPSPGAPVDVASSFTWFSCPTDNNDHGCFFALSACDQSIRVISLECC
eukprot:3024550-Prymnesium_polylepis.1